MTVALDIGAARRFLGRIDPEAQEFVFQTFDDDEKRKRKQLAKVHTGDPGNGLLDRLGGFNSAGAGIFVVVNRTDGKGRKEHNVIAVRAVFADLDADTPEEARQLLAAVLQAPLMPHIVTASSACGFHCIWLCSDCPLELFKPVQLAIAARFDGDHQVHDLPRVLRVPGFMHNKGEPFLTHELEGVGFNGPPYTLGEIVGGLNLKLSPATPAARPSGAPEEAVHVDDRTLRELRSALCAIPADDRDVWVCMGQALVRLGDAGRALWFEWSMASEKYDAVDAGRCWRSFKGERTSYPAVFAEAKRHGWLNPGAGSGSDGEARTAGAKPRNDDAPHGLEYDFADALGDHGDEADELIEGVITRGALSCIYGDSNSGKTFLAIDIACAIARSVHWMGRNVERGMVVYLATESPASVRRRLRAYQRHHGVRVPNFVIVQSPIDLYDGDADTCRVIGLVRSLEKETGLKCALAVGDTLSRLCAGANENSGEDMSVVVKHADRIRHECGTHFLLIHHTGKDAARGMRGWSGMRAAIDTEIEVTADDTIGAHAAEITKQRDIGGKGDRIGFRLEVVEMGIGKWGKPITSCVVVSADAPARAERGKRPSEIAGAITELLTTRGAGMRKGDLVDHLASRYTKPAIYRELKKMTEAKRLREVVGIIGLCQ